MEISLRTDYCDGLLKIDYGDGLLFLVSFQNDECVVRTKGACNGDEKRQLGEDQTLQMTIIAYEMKTGVET